MQCKSNQDLQSSECPDGIESMGTEGTPVRHWNARNEDY